MATTTMTMATTTTMMTATMTTSMAMAMAMMTMMMATIANCFPSRARCRAAVHLARARPQAAVASARRRGSWEPFASMPPPLASSSVAAPPEAGTPSPDSPRMARVSPPATLVEVQLLCVLQLLAICRRGFGGIPFRQEEDRLSMVESAQEVARTHTGGNGS